MGCLGDKGKHSLIRLRQAQGPQELPTRLRRITSGAGAGLAALRICPEKHRGVLEQSPQLPYFRSEVFSQLW